MMENLIEFSMAREPDHAISLVRLFVGVSFVVVVVDDYCVFVSYFLGSKR